MLAYDEDQTATLLETLRPTHLFIPVLLAVTCGLRRGEILALRWRHLDLGDNRRQMSIEESAEQTDDGVRYKEPKSGRARTVALSASTVAELKAHRTRPAEEQLRLGLRPNGDSFVVAQVDGSPLQPSRLRMSGCASWERPPCPVSAFMTSAHPRHTDAIGPAFIQRSPANALGTRPSGLHWIFIPMSCPACRRTRRAS
nr:tyrosine-type recombinase/integrase [Mesorhizobium sp. AA22]